MQRRDFITLLGGAAVAWPFAARAQQDTRMRRIGALVGGERTDDLDTQTRVGAFRQGLQQLGWVDGQNVRIDVRAGSGDADRTRRYAEELVALAPDVIVTTGSAAVAPMLKATRTVPVVFTSVVDPVGAGFVNSLARPGGNATGFVKFEYVVEREMAGAAQRGRAGREAGSRHTRSRNFWRNWSVWRNPDGCALVRSGPDSDQSS